MQQKKFSNIDYEILFNPIRLLYWTSLFNKVKEGKVNKQFINQLITENVLSEISNHKQQCIQFLP